MQNTMRKILSAVLVCVLFLGMMPAVAMPAAADSQLTDVSAWNLVLADEIAVNFQVSISDAAAEDAVMQVTDGYGTTAYPICEAEKTEDGLYQFTGYLAAAQMTDEITLQLISGEEAGPVHSYSAAEYAQTVLAGDYSQSTKDLLLAMLHYGAAAQLYFGYNVEKLANAGYEAAQTPEMPAYTAGNVVSGNVGGISYYAASLLNQSRIAVRFYFSVSGNVADYTFTAGGKTLEPAAKGEYYYVDVPGINPQNYDKTVAVQVSDGTDTMTVSYSPMTYILRMYANTSNEALRTMVAAMYQYHAAAKAYLSVSGDVTTDGNGIVTEQVTLQGNQSSAVVAAGTQLEENTTTLTLSTIAMNQTGSDVVLGENEQMVSMDVHVEGISESNTVPVLVTLNELAPEFLNQGNISLYHVENGETVEMIRVYALEELDAHNEYYYDIISGTVTVALASFSEIVVRSNNDNAWKGEYNYEWYDAEKTELTIANADQLAAFGAIVGGMIGNEQDSFNGKTVKLIADISIGDTDSENGIVFYPIGYYNSSENYNKVSGGSVSSGFYTFEGTFDGQGHTVSNFYQNTWEMFGDYNDGYSGTPNHYRDGMGLFGKVYGGTVKNLTVKNFSSDGEFTTTGTIAAYADCGATFENIAIFNCNPRVYNIGNGGIVGCVGWYANTDVENPVTFKNITVDNSNKISALWGSWDVACGGLVGQYYPTSGQSNAIDNVGVYFENCHVAAQIDVYNDVCANYQYYAYRYAGMMIGSIRENVTIDGHVYPNMDGISASGCTVHFGDWNDYYYCELVANSLASYTHDHQMSRLDQVTSVDVDNKTVTYLDGTTEEIPAGRQNYVVVTNKNDKGEWIHGDGADYATCYHFVDGVQHKHDVADNDNPEITETVNGVEGVLKEDKQLIYREFNNLFTGYGWGVTTKAIDDYAEDQIKILDRVVADSVEKFETVADVQTNFISGTVVNIGDLFEAAELPENVTIDTDNVQVFVSPADETSSVSGTYVANTTDWTKGTLTLTGKGNAVITITDYNYCVETRLEVEVVAYNVTFAVPNGVEAIDTMTSGVNGITLPTAADYTADGVSYTFVGWSETPITETTTDKPVVLEEAYVAAKNTILYPVYSYSENTAGETTWTLVTDASTLSAGDELVIACNTKNVVAGDLSGSYLASKSATFGEDTISSLPADAIILTLGGSIDNWTFANSVGYLLGTTAAKALAWANGTTTWTITISDNNATIKSTITSNGWIQYNSSSPRFTTYTSNQTLPQLYKKSVAGAETTMYGSFTEAHEHSYENGICTVCSAVEPSVYVATEIGQISSQQNVIITMLSNGKTYALYNGNGTADAPIAVEVEVVDGKIETAEETLLWNIVNENGRLTIYPAGTTETWLYCTNTNDGVLVGKNENKTFVIHSTSGYLKHEGTERYLGVYDNQDWRCYTSTTGNIANQTLAFYALPINCDHSDKVAVDAVDPSCNTVGYTACQQCSNCGTYFGREEIPALGHSEVIDEGKAATCTETGLTEGKHCSVCGEDTVPQDEIPATGVHTYENGVCTGCGAEEPTQPSEPASSGFVKTDIAKIASGDTVIITMSKGTDVWAMSNNNSTGSAPTAVGVTVSNNILTAEDYDVISWTITVNSDGSLSFQADGSNYLYCTATNNGVRVGTNTANSFKIDATGSYLVHTGTGRYVGVYTTNPDWRCYTSINANITGQTLAFYVLSDGTSTEPDDTCVHENTTTTSTATCTEAGVETVTCDDCGVTVSSEEIPALGHNYVDGTCTGCSEEEPATGGTKCYKKVTEAPTDWSGTYLIVYEDGKVAFDGGLATLDAVSNTIAVEIKNDTIVSDETTDAAAFTIEVYSNGYSIQGTGGKYMGNASDSNALTSSVSALVNTISFNGDKTVNIVGAGGAYLRYNATSGQNRFRYYKSSSYTNQKAICLYELVEE